MAKESMGCVAQQVSDQMRCEQCDLTWDMNDPDPPECTPDPTKAKLAGVIAKARFRRDKAAEAVANDPDPDHRNYWRGVRQAYRDIVKDLEAL